MKPGAQIPALIASFAMTASAAASAAEDTLPDPAVLFAVLFLGAVLVVLVGIGIIIGLVCVACAAVFVALGIVSASALIAMLQRRFTAGLRALHYQLLAAIAVPCGIGALWFACALFDFPLRHRYILLIGSAIGLIAGICIAFILDRFVRFAYRRFVPLPELTSAV